MPWRRLLQVARAAPFIGAAAAAADAAILMNQSAEMARRFQENLTFPSDLNTAVPYITMQFKAYERRSIYQQPFYRDVMRIALPMPENLGDLTSVNYEKEKLGSALGSIAEALSTGVPGVSEAARRAYGVGIGAAAQLGAYGAGQAARAIGLDAQDANRVLALGSALSGVTTNPFEVVLFKHPNFKTHGFSWKFVPRDENESKIIRDLVETFKYHSLPGISTSSGVFFSFPEILQIVFRPSDEYLYKFKPCVVDSVQVNYAPNSPSFYKSTGAPTAVQFSIKVQEIEIWTKADFSRNIDGTIRYT